MQRFIILLILLHYIVPVNAEKYIKVDFSQPSSQKRFIVYDNDKVIFSCKCAHGKGGNSTAKTPDFSNKIGSNCSCLGKFKIVGYHKHNGIKYLELEGLCTTNSNAKVRGICIHNSKLVSIWKYIPFVRIPLSNASLGCFAIDNSSMKKLIKMYDNKELTYIYAKK